VFRVRIGLRDPRSQKRDLGHPSVSPFDIAEGEDRARFRSSAFSTFLGETEGCRLPRQQPGQ
jgi:hypothetical protein